MAGHIHTWAKHAIFHVAFDVHVLKMNLSNNACAQRIVHNARICWCKSYFKIALVKLFLDIKAVSITSFSDTIDNEQQVSFTTIYDFVLTVVVALPSYHLKHPNIVMRVSAFLFDPSSYIPNPFPSLTPTFVIRNIKIYPPYRVDRYFIH